MGFRAKPKKRIINKIFVEIYIRYYGPFGYLHHLLLLSHLIV
jgi:hypothetical protein